MFRYLVHDPNKHSGVGFKRLRHPTLNHPCKGGYNTIGSIGYRCLPGVAAICQLGFPKLDLSIDSMVRQPRPITSGGFTSESLALKHSK